MNPTPEAVPDGGTALPPLDRRLLAFWPALAERLGVRSAGFIEAARQQAARRGLDADPAAAARYVNLCFAFGPAFEDKPENEWALAVLIDERLAPHARLHQLVVRGLRELRRRGGDEQALTRADAALLDALDLGRQSADAEAPPLARTACDIEAVELRLADIGWRREYRRQDSGAWQLVPGPAAPPAVRIDAGRPAPEMIAVLTHAPGDGPAAWLQLRQIAHGGCPAERHPAVRWLGTHGLAQWRGAEARSVGWPVHALRQPTPATGLGVALFEETSPDIGLLEIPSCGVRDEGVPLGMLRTQVWAYPAHQWLYVLQREAAPVREQRWPRADAVEPSAAPSATTTALTAPTRCRIERDGTVVDAAGWLRGFDAGLPQALDGGLERLHAAWRQVAGEDAVVRAAPGLLTGRAVLGWGWREAPGGLAARPLLRALAEIDLACAFELALEGEIAIGAARSRVRLTARGEERLVLKVLREAPQPGLAETLLPAVVKLRLPFVIEHDPLANAEAVVCSRLGPCTGAVVGEAGLRPRLSGGSGWQWYVRLAIEPVLVPAMLHDPLLGQTHRMLALLPALPLLDWSLG